MENTLEHELIFRYLLLALLLSFMLHRGLQTRKHSPSQDRVVRKLKLNSNSVLSRMLSLLALSSSLTYILAPNVLDFASLGLPLWLRWLGVPVVAAGFALMEWAQNSLGENWSDTPVQIKGQTLATSGPYRWVRHPMYSAFLLILTTPLLFSANWLIGLSWIGMTALDVAARMQAEEAMLKEIFGEAFEQHSQKTGRLLPRFIL